MAALLIGGNPLDGAFSVLLALSVVALVLILSPRLARVVTSVIATESSEMLVLSMLGLTLLVAGLAEEIQVSAAVGAFLVGIVLSGPVVEQGREVIAPLRDVFAAIFFVFFGLQIDPGALPGVALPAITLAVASVLTKLGTGWWAAGRAGVAAKGRARAAVSLVPHGEFSIVIAGLGVAAGVEDELGPFVACYVLVLAIVGALGIRYADSLPVPAGAGRRITPR
jgi:CPA2 family monovalent cation:H+ antiporter-2